jgi:hypothetical protein
MAHPSTGSPNVVSLQLLLSCEYRYSSRLIASALPGIHNIVFWIPLNRCAQSFRDGIRRRVFRAVHDKCYMGTKPPRSSPSPTPFLANIPRPTINQLVEAGHASEAILHDAITFSRLNDPRLRWKSPQRIADYAIMAELYVSLGRTKSLPLTSSHGFRTSHRIITWQSMVVG